MTPEPTSWTIHLAARAPQRAALALLIVLLGVVAVALIGAPPVMIVLAALLLLGSIAEFLLPVTYTLDATGAHARHLGSHRVIPWGHVRRVYLRRSGVKLSPLAAPSPLEPYRGVMLRTPERDAVVAQVRAWLDAAGAHAEVIEEA